MYNRQPQRLFEYVPIWTFKDCFRYAPRHGVKVEALPWGYGKEWMTFSYQADLARWTKRLSWKATADIFETSWDTVFRAVKFIVGYGRLTGALTGSRRLALTKSRCSKGTNT